jgi:hypothetical protein
MQTQESFLEGLAQGVVAERIEIDYVDLRRPVSEVWDRRALLVHLVRTGLAKLGTKRTTTRQVRISFHGTYWPVYRTVEPFTYCMELGTVIPSAVLSPPKEGKASPVSL